MRHSFSKLAKSYDNYALLQKQIAKDMIKNLDVLVGKKDYESLCVLDLGCGSGFLARHLNDFLVDKKVSISTFIGVDSSSNMLQIHPKDLSNITQIRLIQASFDEIDSIILDKEISLKAKKGDLIILSSSALQWSKDIKSLFLKLKNLKANLAISLFTSNTLCQLHSFLDTTSPLYELSLLKELILHYFHVKISTSLKTIYFTSQKQALDHLKKNALLSSYDKKESTLELPFSKKKKLYSLDVIKELDYEYISFYKVFI